MWCAFYSQWGKDKPINDKKKHVAKQQLSVLQSAPVSVGLVNFMRHYLLVTALKVIQYGLSSFLCATHIITDNNSACLFTCITLV